MWIQNGPQQGREGLEMLQKGVQESRVGTYFHNQKLPFATAVAFFYFWARDYSSYTNCLYEFGMNQHAFVDWSNYMRDACLEEVIFLFFSLIFPSFEKRLGTWRTSKLEGRI